MLELGSSGSVRGVLSNEHPYRHPRPLAEVLGSVVKVGLRPDSGRWSRNADPPSMSVPNS